MSGPRKLIIIGGGDHARVVADAVRSRSDQWKLVGFVDPKPNSETAARLNIQQFASDEAAVALRTECSFVIGIGRIGSAHIRRRLAERYSESGAQWATIVHSTAWVSSDASLSPGVVVMAGAMINTGAVLEQHGIVNTGAIVEHDVRLGQFTFVGPGVAIGGGVSVGEESFLGLGCRIRDHVRVGRRCTIGMGSVVIKDVADGACVMGVPAAEN